MVAVEVLATDEEMLQQVTAGLAGRALGDLRRRPVVSRVPGQLGVSGRLYLDVRRPVGRRRELPAEWVRFVSPLWGGRVPEVKPDCIRARANGISCTRQAAEWPAGFVEDVDPGACWSHLDEGGSGSCTEVRSSR